MKKFLLCLVVLIAVASLVAPAFAVESKFAGSFRVRYDSNDNMANGNDDIDDNRNFADQRLRLYYYAVASENLRFVYKMEVGDMTWGQNVPGSVGKGQGGGQGLDGVNVETKNAYVDFTLNPVRIQLGGQGVTLHQGWWLDDDFAAARFDMSFDAVSVLLYYAQHTNTDVTSVNDDIWNTGLSVGYTAETFNLRGSLGWQRNQQPAGIDKDNLYILMADAGFNFDWWSAFILGGVNFGSKEYNTSGMNDQDYKGYLVDGGVDFNFDPFTLAVEAFYVSGDDDANDGDIESFTYFAGRSHYWAEILGLGTLDREGSTVGDDGPGADGNVSATESAGLYAIKVGGTWKALEDTKLTLNLWYVGSAEDRTDINGDTDDKIGTEVDFYLDQKLMDNLKFQFIGAYLFAEDGFGLTGADDDAYQVGGRIQMDW
jgi:hypothetical protein